MQQNTCWADDIPDVVKPVWTIIHVVPKVTQPIKIHVEKKKYTKN